MTNKQVCNLITEALSLQEQLKPLKIRLNEISKRLAINMSINVLPLFIFSNTFVLTT